MNLFKTGVILFFALSVSMLVVGQSHEESGYHPNEIIKNVQIYPNPSVDYLHVKFETPIAKTSKLIVHSILGNEIEVENEVIDEFEVRIRVKDLNIGYYILAVHDQANNAKGTFKFLKR